jgi:deoxyhypusine monooxygenase
MHDTDSSVNKAVEGLSTAELRDALLDVKKSLFERYRAMFALRNIGDREAVLALADGFADSSALFRHEIAYIFGQLCSEHSVPALLKVLKDEQESEMVRHEAAEALGSIASDDVLPALREFSTKGPRVVRESCEVALDMYEVSLSSDLTIVHQLTGSPVREFWAAQLCRDYSTAGDC